MEYVVRSQYRDYFMTNKAPSTPLQLLQRIDPNQPINPADAQLAADYLAKAARAPAEKPLRQGLAKTLAILTRAINEDTHGFSKKRLAVVVKDWKTLEAQDNLDNHQSIIKLWRCPDLLAAPDVTDAPSERHSVIRPPLQMELLSYTPPMRILSPVQILKSINMDAPITAENAAFAARFLHEQAFNINNTGHQRRGLPKALAILDKALTEAHSWNEQQLKLIAADWAAVQAEENGNTSTKNQLITQVWPLPKALRQFVSPATIAEPANSNMTSSYQIAYLSQRALAQGHNSSTIIRYYANATTICDVPSNAAPCIRIQGPEKNQHCSATVIGVSLADYHQAFNAAAQATTQDQKQPKVNLVPLQRAYFNALINKHQL
jgi:hypothetical protein